MRIADRVSRIAAVGVLSVGLAACSGGAVEAPPSATPPPSAPEPPAVVAECGQDDSSWTTVPGTTVEAAARGSGPTVVFANDSGNFACGWIPLATQLSDGGYRVVVFRYADTSPPAESDALADLVELGNTAGEGNPYAGIGASLGGRLVIEAAATQPPHLIAIASLSGERTVENYRDILRDAARVTTPVLYVGARDDELTQGTRQQDQLHAAMRRAHPNELLQVDGLAHGTELLDLSAEDGRSISDHLVAFVEAQLPV